MKKTILFSTILCFFVVTANGQTKKYQHKPSYQANAGEIKFGPRIIDGTGMFVEYKFTDQLGLQSGLFYDLSAHLFIRKSQYIFQYLSLPITLRLYVGETKRFCWYGGIKGYYLLAGHRVDSSSLAEVNLKEADGNERASNYDLSIDFGFDYETSFGLIWGFRLFTKGLITVVEEPDIIKNWGTLRLILGYNFAKLM